MPLVNKIQIIGHVCHDKVPEGYILGGTASYCSIFAKKLCPSIALLSSYGPDFQFKETFDQLKIDSTIIDSEQTTIFENTYSATTRVQYLHSKASDLLITPSSILSDSDILFLCPITNEIRIEENTLSNYKGLKAATIQGWLRDFAADGLVIPSLPDLSLFSNLDIIIMSDDDIRGFDQQLTEELKELVDIVVITRGERGAEVYQSGTSQLYPSFPCEPIDLTGAGDIFSIAFLYEYARSNQISAAAAYAHAAASLSIEGKGVSAIPSHDQILKRQQFYNKRYL